MLMKTFENTGKNISKNIDNIFRTEFEAKP